MPTPKLIPMKGHFMAMRNCILFSLFFFFPLSVLAQTVCASGAGDNTYNGTYTLDGSGAFYENESDRFLVDSAGDWLFCDMSDCLGSIAYPASESGQSSPVGLNYFVADGVDPAPSVSVCPTPTPTPTPTATPTATPTPTPTPVANGYPEEVCLNESDAISVPFAGTYTLVRSDAEKQSFRYNKVGDPDFWIITDDLGIVVDVLVRRRGRLSYINRFLAQETITPIGRYFSFLKQEETIYCGPEDSEDIRITEGECTDFDTLYSAEVPSTSITGEVLSAEEDRRNIRNGEDVPELEPGVVYAILFKGLSPDEAGGKFPVGFTSTTSGNSYTFEDVIPGEYHIVFKALDSEFTPERVSVTVVGSDPAAAPDTTIRSVDYDDEGCSTTVIAGSLTSVNSALTEFRSRLTKQLRKMSTLAEKRVKNGRKRKKLSSRIRSALDFTDEKYDEILGIADTYPTSIRTNCPQDNGCTETSLEDSKSSFLQAVSQLNRREKKIVRPLIRAMKGKKKLKKGIRRRSKAVSRKLGQVRKASTDLPESHEVCPEVE